MADEKLKGTHIRLTSYHLTKAKEKAKKKNMSLAQFIRVLIEKL
jgi:predicted DNA binding CopG/RHH family protein